MLKKSKAGEAANQVILEKDVLSRNDRKTLVQVALKGQPFDAEALENGLESGLYFYREDSVVRPSPTLGKSAQTSNFVSSAKFEISINEFLQLPSDEQKALIDSIAEKQPASVLFGADVTDTENANPFLSRLDKLKDQYQSRDELEAYAKTLGIENPTKETFRNIKLLSEAIVRKENGLPEDFDFNAETEK